MLKDNWSKIAEYVPQSTLECLKKIKDTVKQRIEKQKKQYSDNAYIQNQIREFVDRICSYERIVIYTVGSDTKGLIKYLPAEIVERCEFCDKSASTKSIIFNGKTVEPPESLLQKYKDYKIIVTSTRYGAEIYEEFIKMGIEMERCIFNSIVFNAAQFI